MTAIRFVVTGCPRSGTRHIATLIQRAGIPCGHENHLVCEKARVSQETGAPWGDSSWLAAGWLDEIPQETVVLHQVRDPVKVINSGMAPNAGNMFRDWPPDEGADKYRTFIHQRTQDWPWQCQKSELEREMLFWVRWNELVERKSESQGRTYFRYRIEDMDGPLLEVIWKLIARELTCPPTEVLHQHTMAVDKTLNHRAAVSDAMTPALLSHDARKMANRYGYEY